MANKKNNTKAVENVSRETSVHGTTNNVGQEIEKIAPSETEVVSCTMTEEEHQARKERIIEIQEKCLRGSWDMMVEIASAKSRKEQTLDGYSESEGDFEKWALEQFGIKSTQVRQYVRVLETYGRLADNGEYTLEEKYKRYTREKLDIIQRHPQFKTRASFDALVDALGITPSTSEDILKELVREAKGLPAPQTKEKAKSSKADAEHVVTVEEVKETQLYKDTLETRDILLKWVSDIRAEAREVADSKDNKKAMEFVNKLIESFGEMEKSYNNVTRKEEPKAEEPKAE